MPTTETPRQRKHRRRYKVWPMVIANGGTIKSCRCYVAREEYDMPIICPTLKMANKVAALLNVTRRVYK